MLLFNIVIKCNVNYYLCQYWQIIIDLCIAHTDWDSQLNYIIKKICTNYTNSKFTISSIISELCNVCDVVSHSVSL